MKRVVASCQSWDSILYDDDVLYNIIILTKWFIKICTYIILLFLFLFIYFYISFVGSLFLICILDIQRGSSFSWWKLFERFFYCLWNFDVSSLVVLCREMITYGLLPNTNTNNRPIKTKKKNTNLKIK